MESFHLKWGFWTVIALAAVVLLALALRGPQPPRPLDCARTTVTDTVLDIVRKNGVWGDSEYRLEDIGKTSADDPAATRIACAAKVWVDSRGMPFHSAAITYTVERDDQGTVTVTVSGLKELNSFP